MTAIARGRVLLADLPARIGRYPYVLAVRGCWRASRTYAALLLGVAILSGLVPLLLYVAFAIFVGAVISPSTSAVSLEAGIAILAALFLLLQVRDPFVSLFIGRLARRLDSSLQRTVIGASVTPRTIGHLSTEAFDRAATATRDWETSAHPPADAAWAISNFTQNGLVGLGSAILVMQFAWWAPFVLAAGFLLLGVWGSRIREGPEVARVRGEADLRRAAYLRELTFQPASGREARLFGLSAWLRDRSDDNWRSAMARVWAARNDTWAVAILTLGVLIGGHLLVFGLIAQAMIEQRVDVAQAALYIQGASGLVNLWMPWALVTLRESTAPLPLVYALSPRPGATGVPSLDDRTAGLDPQGLPRERIEFRDLTFTYPGRSEPVLDGFNLALRAGQSVAIVGPNGAGKTTLVKLLCGLLEPTSGSIEVDGIDLARLDRAAWQGRVAAIFQDFVRYPFTARDNIVLGRPAGTEEAFRRAVDRARTQDVLDGLPEGVDTPLAREFGGVDLSGGQWQRIALARAMYAVERGAGVLILDEPTAHLDVRAEAELFDRFLDMTAGLTTVLISHRFSSVRHAGRIVVLEGGRIVEDGSHAELVAAATRYAELVAAATRYAELFQLQARHFEASPDA